MQNCTFCSRRFKSRQAVRGHLRTCPSYAEALADGSAVRKPRTVTVEVHVCAGCGYAPGGAGKPVTMIEINESYLGGCPWCGCRQWESAGWERMLRHPL